MSALQHDSGSGRRSDAFIIEIRDRTAGIVAGDGRDYRFFASERAFDSLEGRIFRSARHAERAVRALARSGRARAFAG